MAAPARVSDAGIRALIAKHLEVDLGRVTDAANFIHDLGADWLDRLELMILVEDHFPGLHITDEDADKIRVVGDLIRYITSWIQRVDGNERFAGVLGNREPDGHKHEISGH